MLQSPNSDTEDITEDTDLVEDTEEALEGVVTEEDLVEVDLAEVVMVEALDVDLDIMVNNVYNTLSCKDIICFIDLKYM